MNANGSATDQQAIFDHKIYHNTLPSNHPNYSLYTMFEYGSREMYFYKLMLVPSAQSHLIQFLYIKRSEVYQHMAQLRNDSLSLPSRYFSSKLNLSVEAQKEQGKSRIKIKQPYLPGINLKQILVEFNNSRHREEKEMHVFLQNMISQLINLFLRVKQKAFFIPTFRSIIFDKNKNKFNLNLFSFVGVKLKLQDGPINQTQLRQILPFLNQSLFQKQQNWINLPRALAAIILGVICGKEITLLTSKSLPIGGKQELKQVLKRSSQKYRKMLTSKQVITSLSIFQKVSKLTIKQFMYRVLVNEQAMSWSECIGYLYSSKQLIKKQPQSELQKIENILKNIAQQAWRDMKQQDKIYYIYNNILTVTRPDHLLQSHQDCQLLLVISKKLDYNLVNSYGGLAQLILKTHHTHQSTFNSKLTQLVSSLVRKGQDGLGYDISYFTPQSYSNKCSDYQFTDKDVRQSNFNLQKAREISSNFKPQKAREISNQINTDLEATKQQIDANSQRNFKPQSHSRSAQYNPPQPVDQNRPQDNCQLISTLQTLMYQQQVHKFNYRKSTLRIESDWLKTLRHYQKIAVDQ